MPIRFDHPQLLLLLLLAAPLALMAWWGLAALEPGRRYLALGVRVAVLALLVLMLAGMQAIRRHDDLTVIGLLDTSAPVTQFARFPDPQAPDQKSLPPELWFKNYLDQAGADRRPDDLLAFLEFSEQVQTRAMPAPLLDLGPRTGEATPGCDPALAIEAAVGMSTDTAKRIVLASSGNFSVPMDRVLAAAREARAANIPIDVLPIVYRLDHEVMAEGPYVPREARIGQSIPIRIVLTGTNPADGRLFLNLEGQVVPLPSSGADGGLPVRAGDWVRQSSLATTQPGGVAADRYTYVYHADLTLTQKGAQRFKAVFVPAEGTDTSPANNTSESFTYVQGKGKVLLIGSSDNSGAILAQVLREHGIDLEVMIGSEVDRLTTLADLQRYDEVILQNVPADLFMPNQVKMLAQYVKDLGGGLVMIGGPDSFGAGGWTDTEVDRILPLECRIPNQAILPSGALVIVLDHSGSMAEPVGGSGAVSKQVTANEAAVRSLAQLYPQDLVGVIAFDSAPTWVVRLQPNGNPTATASAIRSIVPAGGTSIKPALEQAFNALAPLTAEQAAVRHVILLTDGQDNVGTGQAVLDHYKDLLDKYAAAGISVSTIGVGNSNDIDEVALKGVAARTKGQFYPVQDPNRLPQILIKEVRTIRKNLLKELRFTPKLIQTGSPVTSGMNATPPLRGFVLTGPKNDPMVLMPMRGPEDEPLFAHWQVGLGHVAAFTSDASNRWAVDWLPWGGYADFWSRTVRAMARPSAGTAYEMTSTIRGDTLHIRLDAAGNGSDTISAATPAGNPGSSANPGGPGGPANPGGGFGNFMEIQGSVLTPEGKIVHVHLEQTGPGIYEATVPAKAAGNYIANLFATTPGGGRSGGGPGGGLSGGGGVTAIFGGTAKLPGAELRVFASNKANLEEIARITGGRVLDASDVSPHALFSRETALQQTPSFRPLWRPLLLVLVTLFLFDVAVRRIAWDLGAMRDWSVGRVDALAGLFQTRPVPADSTMAALKKKAQETDRKLSGPTPAPVLGTDMAAKAATPRDASPALSKGAAAHKFEAGADYEASEDFASAVGAAQAEDPSAPIDRGRPAAADTGPTTTRLLDAKRRAAERMNKRTNEEKGS